MLSNAAIETTKQKLKTKQNKTKSKRPKKFNFQKHLKNRAKILIAEQQRAKIKAERLLKKKRKKERLIRTAFVH
jgi:hypothetical protein